MRKLLLTIFFLLISVGLSYAYTLEDVSQHNTVEDCWMVFDGVVYDLTEYIPLHDEYLDIREWCGNDMTEEFKDKAGMGVDHKRSSYSLLESYRIGEVEEGNVVIEEDIVVDESEPVLISTEEEVTEENGYNLIVPFLISVTLYWGLYFLVKKNKFFGLSIVKFNGFWNSILFLTLLIPAFGFGVFMVIRSKKPELWDIDFDFLYWHVEFSLVMGILAINHFIQRIRVYIKQVWR